VRDTLSRPPSAAVGAVPAAAVVTEVLEVILECGVAAPVAGVELVARIPVGAAAIEAAVTQLVDAGDATAAPDGVVLTAAGRDRAVAAVRRHRLVERMLSDLIGLEWWKVHHEAARFEGVVSADVEAALVEQLGDPGTCPHGNPIPGSANQPSHPDAVRLADAPIGPVHVVRITETLEGDDEALQLLQNCGFLPGRDAEVKDRRDGWVEVAGTVHDAAFPHHIAVHTFVAPR
jgi:DtxR family transcriptional regulator, Mn-dependent transcriptional regulator